jgi:hypothetical protein
MFHTFLGDMQPAIAEEQFPCLLSHDAEDLSHKHCWELADSKTILHYGLRNFVDLLPNSQLYFTAQK